MDRENPGQTLQATALVHEAYIRLVDVEKVQHWDSRGHFFSAAAEAMRRILVNHARSKNRLKRGGNRIRIDLDEIHVAEEQSPEALVLIDDALSRLSQQDFEAAELVKLRYFTGFSIDEIAQMTGTSRTVAYGQWEYAKAWLRCDLGGDSSSNF